MAWVAPRIAIEVQSHRLTCQRTRVALAKLQPGQCLLAQLLKFTLREGRLFHHVRHQLKRFDQILFFHAQAAAVEARAALDAKFAVLVRQLRAGESRGATIHHRRGELRGGTAPETRL